MANPDQEKKETKKIKQPTAKKRQLQNKKRRLANKADRSRIRSEVKVFRTMCGSSEGQIAANSLNDLYSLIDKAAKKGLFKANKASRMKSRLTAAAKS
jgi:small subunit ribosomal protein S20